MKTENKYGNTYGRFLIAKDNTIICHICGKSFHDLSKHIRSHGISVIDYRKQFGLNSKQSLVSRVVSEKYRENLLKNSELIEKREETRKPFEEKNKLSKKKSMQWRFSQKESPNGRKISPEGMKVLIANGKKVGRLKIKTSEGKKQLGNFWSNKITLPEIGSIERKQYRCEWRKNRFKFYDLIDELEKLIKDGKLDYETLKKNYRKKMVNAVVKRMRRI